jgi:transglutaminase/protease-like cytokinesis protein 3
LLSPEEAQRIDRHVLPIGLPGRWSSISRHAGGLVRRAESDEAKAYSLFRWMTAHIEYDVRAYLRGSGTLDVSPEHVLRSGKSVCQGYSNLYQRLCEEVGLEAITISGFARGVGYQIGEPVSEQNHAWNAVRLASAWHLVDVTWGAGHLEDGRRYVKRFEPHYFLTRAELFVMDHFPADPEKQLLPQPLTKAAFDTQPEVKPGYHRYGVEMESHHSGILRTDSHLVMSFRAPTGVHLLAKATPLTPTGQSLGYLRRDGGQETRAEFHQEGTRHTLELSFTRHGEHALRIFANPTSQHGSYEYILGYRVSVEALLPR